MKEKIFKITLLFLLMACVGSINATNPSETKPTVHVMTNVGFQPGHWYEGKYCMTVYKGNLRTETRTAAFTLNYTNDYMIFTIEGGLEIKVPNEPNPDETNENIIKELQEMYSNADHIVIEFYVNNPS